MLDIASARTLAPYFLSAHTHTSQWQVFSLSLTLCGDCVCVCVNVIVYAQESSEPLGALMYLN